MQVENKKIYIEAISPNVATVKISADEGYFIKANLSKTQVLALATELLRIGRKLV